MDKRKTRGGNVKMVNEKIKLVVKNGQVYIDDVKPLNKKLIDSDFTLRWKLLKHIHRDANVIF